VETAAVAGLLSDVFAVDECLCRVDTASLKRSMRDWICATVELVGKLGKPAAR